MIQVDVPMALAIGSMFAGAAREQLRTGDPQLACRAALQLNLYHLFFFSWIPVYFAVNYFGWETSHVWWHGDSAADHPFFIPLLLLALGIAVNAGFLSGRWLIRRGRAAVNRALYLGILAYSVLWVVLMGDATSRLGTYRDFVAGAAARPGGDPTFLAMLVFTMLLWPGTLVVFLVRLSREGARVREGVS